MLGSLPSRGFGINSSDQRQQEVRPIFLVLLFFFFLLLFGNREATCFVALVDVFLFLLKHKAVVFEGVWGWEGEVLAGRRAGL